MPLLFSRAEPASENPPIPIICVAYEQLRAALSLFTVAVLLVSLLVYYHFVNQIRQVFLVCCE